MKLIEILEIIKNNTDDNQNIYVDDFLQDYINATEKTVDLLSVKQIEREVKDAFEEGKNKNGN